MPRKSPPCPTYPDWSQAKFWGFIRSALRQKSRRWPPVFEALQKARRESKSGNKRLKWEYKCASCKGWFPQTDVSVDHITPAGSLNCADDLKGFTLRLFCGSDGLQVLCKECHNIKSSNERKDRDDG